MSKYNISPFTPDSLTLVAARPAMGMLDYMCAHASNRLGSHKVLFLTDCESHLQIKKRICADLLSNLMIADTVADDLDGELNHIKNLYDENRFSTVIVEPRKSFYDLTKLKKLAQQLHVEIVTGEQIPSWHGHPGMPEAPTINDIRTPALNRLIISLHFIGLNSTNRHVETEIADGCGADDGVSAVAVGCASSDGSTCCRSD